MNARIVLVLLLAPLGCKVLNPEHCYNRGVSDDGNAWCREAHPGRDFCSPCEEVEPADGCVAIEPTEATCPKYDPGEDSGTGDTTGGEDATGTGSEDGTTGDQQTSESSASG